MGKEGLGLRGCTGLILVLLLAISGRASAVSDVAACSNGLTLKNIQARVLRIGPDEVGIFGYGSLMNLQSLSLTLQRPYDGPVEIAYLQGWERVWNATLPNQKGYRAETPNGPVAPAHLLYLNIEPKADSVINGMIVIVKRADLEALDRRELTYERADVTGQILSVRVLGGKVYTYVGKPEFTAQPGSVFPDVGLRESYIGIVDKALSEYAPSFQSEFRATTREIPPGTRFQDHW